MAILDADKTGFLRSASSLIQTMGRAARNVDGNVVLYADTITDAMRDGHRRDPAPAGPAAGLQRRARHQPHHRPQGGDRHPGPHLRPADDSSTRRGNSRDQGGRAAANGRPRRLSGHTGVPRAGHAGAVGRRGRGGGDGRAPTSSWASWPGFRRRAASPGRCGSSRRCDGRRGAALRGGGPAARRDRRPAPGPGRGGRGRRRRPGDARRSAG